MLVTLTVNYVSMEPQVPKSARFAEMQHKPKATVSADKQRHPLISPSISNTKRIFPISNETQSLKKWLTREKETKLCPATRHFLFFLPYLYLMLWDICNRLNPHLLLAFLLTSEKMQ